MAAKKISQPKTGSASNTIDDLNRKAIQAVQRLSKVQGLVRETFVSIATEIDRLQEKVGATAKDVDTLVCNAGSIHQRIGGSLDGLMAKIKTMESGINSILAVQGESLEKEIELKSLTAAMVEECYKFFKIATERQAKFSNTVSSDTLEIHQKLSFAIKSINAVIEANKPAVPVVTAASPSPTICPKVTYSVGAGTPQCPEPNSSEILNSSNDATPACWIETKSGKFVNLADPDPATITIEDIADHLAAIPRFNGATSRIYSVAEHSVLCCDLAYKRSESRSIILWALLHDAHEAYIGDILTPVKHLIGKEVIQSHQERIDQAIMKALCPKWFYLDPADRKLLRFIDRLALGVEARELMQSKGQGEHWSHWQIPQSSRGISLLDDSEQEAVKEMFLEIYEREVMS